MNNSHMLTALQRIAALAEEGVIQRNETGRPQWSLIDELKKITREAIDKAEKKQTMRRYITSEGIRIKTEDTIQGSSFGTCLVLGIKEDGIKLKNTVSNKEIFLDSESYFSDDWDLIGSIPTKEG